MIFISYNHNFIIYNHNYNVNVSGFKPKHLYTSQNVCIKIQAISIAGKDMERRGPCALFVACRYVYLLWKT